MNVHVRVSLWYEARCLDVGWWPAEAVVPNIWSGGSQTVGLACHEMKSILMYHHLFVCLFVCFWRYSPQWARASLFTGFLDNTQRRTTVVRTPLDEWSARCRDFYLTTYITHNRQTSMPPVGFEPTISANERPQIYTLDRTVTGTGKLILHLKGCW